MNLIKKNMRIMKNKNKNSTDLKKDVNAINYFFQKLKKKPNQLRASES